MPTDHVVTALLRAPLPALRTLRDTINGIEKMIVDEANAAIATMQTPPGSTAH